MNGSLRSGKATTMLTVLVFAALSLGTQALAETYLCPVINDVYIDQGRPDDTQGHRTRVLVSWHSTNLAARGLWRFDIPPAIAAAQIVSAVMHVSRNSTGGAGTAIDVDVFALNAPFDEATDTWNSLAGGSFDTSVVASGTLPAWACPPPCTAAIDLTSLLQGNLDKVRDHGILMMVQDEGTGANRNQNFATKEDVPPSTGAYLEIVVASEADAAPSAPLATLYPNAPNPFNPRTTIAFTVVSPQAVDLRICDLAGRVVRVLRRENVAAGRHEVTWDGTNAAGLAAPSGAYLVILTPDAGERRVVKATLSR